MSDFILHRMATQSYKRRLQIIRGGNNGALGRHPTYEPAPQQRPITLPRLKFMGDEVSDMEYREDGE